MMESVIAQRTKKKQKTRQSVEEKEEEKVGK